MLALGTLQLARDLVNVMICCFTGLEAAAVAISRHGSQSPVLGLQAP